MIKAIIVDDEKHCIDDVMRLLQKVQDKIVLIGTATNVEDALNLVNEKEPDLVFLDVQLGNKTGFDFLKFFKNIPFEIIFTTAFEKYAIDAFKFSAFDYLLKPIDLEVFNNTILRFGNKYNNDHQQKKIEVLFDALQKETLPKKLILPTLTGFELIRISDILYCKGDVNYSHIQLMDNNRFVVSKTLKSIEELLTEHEFYRIHKTYLVNLNHIKKYHKGKGGYVTLTDGSDLTISQRKKDGFLKKVAFMNKSF